MKQGRSLIQLRVIVLFLFPCNQQQQTEEPPPPRPTHIDPNPYRKASWTMEELISIQKNTKDKK